MHTHIRIYSSRYLHTHEKLNLFTSSFEYFWASNLLLAAESAGRYFLLTCRVRSRPCVGLNYVELGVVDGANHMTFPFVAIW